MGIVKFNRGTTKPTLSEGEPFLDTLKKVLHIGENLQVLAPYGVIIIKPNGTQLRVDSLTDVYANTVDGDLIEVRGNHDIGDNSIQLKDGVNWKFIGNPKIETTADYVFDVSNTSMVNQIYVEFFGDVNLISSGDAADVIKYSTTDSHGAVKGYRRNMVFSGWFDVGQNSWNDGGDLFREGIPDGVDFSIAKDGLGNLHLRINRLSENNFMDMLSGFFEPEINVIPAVLAGNAQPMVIRRRNGSAITYEIIKLSGTTPLVDPSIDLIFTIKSTNDTWFR